MTGADKRTRETWKRADELIRGFVGQVDVIEPLVGGMLIEDVLRRMSGEERSAFWNRLGSKEPA